MTTEKKMTLDELRKRKAQLEQEQKQLEEQEVKLMQDEVTSFVTQMMTEIDQYKRYMTDEQRKQLLEKLGFSGKVAKSGGAPRALRREDYEHQLDSGHLGKKGGRNSKEFAEWAASEAGKAWRAANPGQDFPSNPNPNAKEVIFPKTALRKRTNAKKS